MRKDPKCFYFEHKWLISKDFSPFLKQSWQSLEEYLDVPAKLLTCQNRIIKWAGSRFNNLGKQISMLRNKLNILNHSNRYEENLLRISELEATFERLSIQKEIHWNQRARSNWLRHGDRNTSFFHTFASDRRRHNSLKKLISDPGVWHSDDKVVACIMIKYFNSLFSSSKPSAQVLNEVRSSVKPKVNDNMNATLLIPFSVGEVKKALFDMHPSKSPGPDGFTALFFQKAWSWIVEDIKADALHILNANGDVEK